MSVDVEQLRAETPGCAGIVHLNNAGSALPSASTLQAQVDYLEREARIGGYEAAAEASERIARFYPQVARLIGAAPTEIAWAASATHAWQQAFASVPLEAGDRVITTASTYASNYISFLHRAQSDGIEVDVAPAGRDGAVDVEALDGLVGPRTRLICLTHVPTNGGLVNPAAAVGAVARDRGVLYLLDACQSVGQLPVDVERIPCDLLSATGRKYLRGPRGTGFLYVREAVLDQLRPPFPDLHSATWEGPDRYRLRDDAKRFEQWERSYAGVLGLTAAVDDALRWGMDALSDRIIALGRDLRARLGDVDGVTVRDQGSQRCGIVTFTVAGHDPGAVKRHLAADHIHVSVSDPESTLLDARQRHLPPLVRASVHAYNTEAELDQLVDSLRRL